MGCGGREGSSEVGRGYVDGISCCVLLCAVECCRVLQGVAVGCRMLGVGICGWHLLILVMRDMTRDLSLSMPSLDDNHTIKRCHPESMSLSVLQCVAVCCSGL